MSKKPAQFRNEILDHLMTSDAPLPTSTFGRLSRTALLALQLGAQRIHNDERDDPDLNAILKLVSSIGELKGVAMKVGQMLSFMDVDIAPALREALTVLQTHAQPMSASQVRSIIRAELGDRAREILAAFNPEPRAAASIGQVHVTTIHDETPVAVKVQYPGIEKAIAADFGPAAIGTRLISLLYRQAKADALVRETRQRLLQECNYLVEARAQQRYGMVFRHHPIIEVPQVYPRFSARHVLTTKLMHGESLEAFVAENPSQSLRNTAGQALFEFYLGTLYQHRLYNCDPHPGNYLFRHDGTVAMLDYGCVREFDVAAVRKLKRLTQAVQIDKRQDLHRSFVELEMVREGYDYNYDTARALVRSFFGPMLHDKSQVIDLSEARNMRQLITDKRSLLQIAIPGEFLFLLRLRLGLMSVLSTLGAEANWYRLEQEYAQTP